MDNKKTKLTISGSPKKSFKKFDTSKTQRKNTVVIEKKLVNPSRKVVLTNPLDHVPQLQISTEALLLNKTLILRHQQAQVILKGVNLLNREQQKD